MNTWLHFVGRGYYTRAQFVREAERYGVTRRVSLGVLKQMAWGDRVLLVMKDGASAVTFGTFHVEKIAGLSQEVTLKVTSRYESRVTDLGGREVKRGCGCYVQGPSYAVSATVEEIVELAAAAADAGKPMIGGRFHDHDPVRLVDIPQRQGFRLFDYAGFRQALREWARTHGGTRRLPRLRGQFYVSEAPEVPAGPQVDSGRVESVMEYRRA